MDLSRCGLVKIPDEVSALTWLQKLYLNNNQISDVKPLEGLNCLTILVLSDNQISDVKPLEGLNNLTKIDLGNNLISDLPAWIIHTKMDVVHRGNVNWNESVCNLYNNPIENVPVDIIELGNEAIKGYDLLHVKTLWSTNWFNVKQELEEMRNGENLKDYISYDEYKYICVKKGLTDGPQRILIKWLNRLGVVTYFEDSGLNETNVINPEWLTEAFYTIINNKIVAENFGMLKVDQLSQILDSERYSVQKYDFLLSLMRKFELCQQILAQESYLFPDLLTKQEPEFEFDIKTALKFRFKYDAFLPKSILPKFVVRRYGERKDELLWRSGIVLKKNSFLDAEAFIRLDEEQGLLSIYVNGKDKRGYLYNIVSELETIHDDFKGLKYNKHVPCVCKECKGNDKPFYFGYDVLDKAAKKGRKDFPCNFSSDDVSISELLGILFTDKDIEEIIKKLISDTPALQIKSHLESNNIEAFIESVISIFSSIPYLIIGKEEKAYHVPFHILLRSIYDTNARAEEMQNKGRVDSILELDKYIYIFELKYNGKAADAIAQIHAREYYKPYINSGKEIILIGINFSEKERNISEYVCEKLPK